MKNVEKKTSIFIFIVLVGAMSGSLVGDILGNHFTTLSVLKTVYSIGIPKPIFLDLKVLAITFGFNINFNIMSIVGVILAIILYRKC